MTSTVKLHLPCFVPEPNSSSSAAAAISLKPGTPYFSPKFRFLPKPIYHLNELSLPSLPKRPVMSAAFVVKSSLVDPDGGILVDLVFDEKDRVGGPKRPSHCRRLG
ncbi:hypothetical protein MLD38_035005 [Melastoma candidum]|nr:hypothetical protein MLD38_035005 [Melastoma candidum]